MILFLRKLFRSSAPANNRARCKRNGQPQLESLEDRTLLSTIIWQNAGSGTADTDGFQARFGSNAATARSIVRAAIADWQGVIQDFNFDGDSNPATNNTYFVRISAADLGDGVRGSTNITNIDGNGRPHEASITVDDNGGGPGWFFDSTPGDNAEFTNLVTRFTASFAGNTNDFYRTTVHELGHAMGIALDSGLRIQTGGFLTAAGTDQVDSAARLRRFTGPTVSATFTTNGGGHLYEGPADPAFASNPLHPNDLMNAGRTIGAPPTTRELITDMDAQILRDAYGYTIKLPSDRETFLANFNSSTGVLTVNGDPQVLNDTVSIDMQGSNVSVNVDGAGTLISPLALTSIRVNTGDGNDTINVRGLRTGILGFTVPLVIDAGAGNDTINVGSVNNMVDTIDGGLQITGGPGTDVLNVNDQGFSSGREYMIASSSVFAPWPKVLISNYNTVESLVLNTGSGNDTVTIQSTSSATPVTVHAGAGNDTINVGTGTLDALLAGVTVDGQGGTDRVNLMDQAATSNDFYTISNSFVVRNHPSGSQVIRFGLGYTAVEGVVLNATAGNNSISFTSTASGTPVTVNGGAGSDTLASPDPLLGGSSTGATWTITARDGGKVNNITFNSVENLTGGVGPDVFTFASQASALTGRVNGGGGTNWLNCATYPAAVAVRLPISGIFSTFGSATATGGVLQIQNVIGSRTAQNTLTGNNDPLGNILVGGDAADTITASTARSILIGGRGADVLTGGTADDIVIGGFTDYDNNVAALQALMATWRNPADDYPTRIAKLRGATTGLTPNPLRLVQDAGSRTGTVHDDGAADTLRGDPSGSSITGLDWFFANRDSGTLDTILDLDGKREKVNNQL